MLLAQCLCHDVTESENFIYKIHNVYWYLYSAFNLHYISKHLHLISTNELIYFIRYSLMYLLGLEINLYQALV